MVTYLMITEYNGLAKRILTLLTLKDLIMRNIKKHVRKKVLAKSKEIAVRDMYAWDGISQSTSGTVFLKKNFAIELT